MILPKKVFVGMVSFLFRKYEKEMHVLKLRRNTINIQRDRDNCSEYCLLVLSGRVSCITYHSNLEKKINVEFSKNWKGAWNEACYLSASALNKLYDKGLFTNNNLYQKKVTIKLNAACFFLFFSFFLSYVDG